MARNISTRSSARASGAARGDARAPSPAAATAAATAGGGAAAAPRGGGAAAPPAAPAAAEAFVPLAHRRAKRSRGAPDAPPLVSPAFVAGAEAAWDVEPDVAVDESCLRLASRFCAFVTTMLCKPIKRGLTIYCAVFPSGYLYDWSWFTGSGDAAAPRGQPTDVGDLDEGPCQAVLACA